MIKLLRISLVLLAILSLVITGCGGGGGTTPTIKTTRTISGKIISSVGGVGVANVKVTLGNTTNVAYSNSTGAFSFTASINSSIPTFIKVDTTGAGTAFPAGGIVMLGGQKYLPNFIDIPADVLNGVSEVIGDITIYDISDSVPPPPFTNKSTIISGRIVSSNTGLGIANATITFGETTKTTVMTGALGYFSIDLGLNAEVKSIYPDSTSTFSVDTATAGTAFPSTLPVALNGTNYLQSAVTVPSEVVNDETTVLGIIYLRDDPGGDDDNPPPPPDDGGGDQPPPPPL